MWESEAALNRQLAEQMETSNPLSANYLRDIAGEEEELASAWRLAVQQNDKLLALCGHVQALRDVAEFEDGVADKERALGLSDRSDKDRSVAGVLRDDANQCDEAAAVGKAAASLPEPTFTNCYPTFGGGVNCVQY